MVGVSVTKTAYMFGISRGTVSKVVIAFVKEKKTSHQNPSLAESQSCQRETVELYIIKLLKITSELIEHPQNHLSTKIVRRELHKNILRKSCNLKTSAFKAFGVESGPSKLVS